MSPWQGGYGEGYRDGYSRARAFYGFTAPEALRRIADATAELRARIEATGGHPPAELLRYFDTIDANTQTINGCKRGGGRVTDDEYLTSN